MAQTVPKALLVMVVRGGKADAVLAAAGKAGEHGGVCFHAQGAGGAAGFFRRLFCCDRQVVMLPVPELLAGRLLEQILAETRLAPGDFFACVQPVSSYCGTLLDE